jgi:hypothetical protein
MALAAAVLLAACGGAGQNSQEAVQQGVMDHLSTRSGLDVGSMDVKVTSVEFRGDEAEATVSFQAKGSTDPAAGMQMNYTLERKGKRWVVKGKSGGDGAHGGGAADAHGATPPAGELPPGHPPTGDAAGSGKRE